MTRYPRTYAMLKRIGHSPLTALTIVVDASRGDRRALDWIRAVRGLVQN